MRNVPNIVDGDATGDEELAKCDWYLSCGSMGVANEWRLEAESQMFAGGIMAVENCGDDVWCCCRKLCTCWEANACE